MTHLEFDLNVDIIKNIAEINPNYEVKSVYYEEIKKGIIVLIHKKWISEKIIELLKNAGFEINEISIQNNKINAKFFLE